MLVLGLEGTAHTVSAGIVSENSILSNSSSTYIPETGGIHPREAAIHHADKIIDIMKDAFDNANVKPEDIGLVTFSMGPGLGPCLRVVATAARAFSIKYNIPVIGVNHPMGHVEIGRKLSGAKDPIMLYISGGNTQIIAHELDRYIVLGETMDIGLGNMLDKFARDSGIPFPGGPVIEKLALKGNKLLDLPYSVKGMDTSFSGLYTAAKSYLKKESINDICYSMQEVSFSMVIEVLERALYYTNKNEILLAGGVARNDRLRSMVSLMAKDAGYKAYLTDKKYCMDNGAMIAQAGLLMYNSGTRMNIMDTKINQKYRIDEVYAPWIKSNNNTINKNKGAESIIKRSEFFNRNVIIKRRIIKGYRNNELDKKIRYARMKNEFLILYNLYEKNFNVPVIYDFNKYDMELTMENIDGITLNEYLINNSNYNDILSKTGEIIGKMHSLKITHGDLTPNNIIVKENKIYLIDPSMGSLHPELEDMGDDIFLFIESLKALYKCWNKMQNIFLNSYRNNYHGYKDIMDTVKKISERRRYV